MIEDDEMQMIYRTVYALRAGADFEAIDNQLRQVDITNTTVAHLLAWLTITAASKERLPYRAEFFRKTAERFKTNGSNIDGLLSGLE